MDDWRQKYEAYIRSTRWKNMRKDILRIRDRCEGCGTKHFLELHHKTYERLGRESPSDLEVLCRSCHERADRERERHVVARSVRARFDAGLETFATKKYGEDWHQREDEERVAEEFEKWLEDRDGQ
jgi:5-methylcytosine-specific restriction endonuclease McrA